MKFFRGYGIIFIVEIMKGIVITNEETHTGRDFDTAVRTAVRRARAYIRSSQALKDEYLRAREVAALCRRRVRARPDGAFAARRRGAFV